MLSSVSPAGGLWSGFAVMIEPPQNKLGVVSLAPSSRLWVHQTGKPRQQAFAAASDIHRPEQRERECVRITSVQLFSSVLAQFKTPPQRMVLSAVY